MSNIDGYRGHNLVFIVGCARSGTTWLQRMLASHPKVRTGQESFLFSWYVAPQLRRWRRELTRQNNSKTASQRGGVGLSCYFQEAEFLPILKNYMFQLLRPMVGNLQPGELFVEKTPLHALCLSEIRELLPESRVIHIVRDPRDVVASLLAASRSWGVGWAPRGSRTAVRMWVQHVRTATEAANAISPGRFVEIRYETLLTSPESTLRDVADFLGLQWDAAAIRKAIEDNKAETVKAGGGTPIPLYGEVAERVGSIVRDPPDFIRSAKLNAWRSNLGLWHKFVVWYVANRPMRQMGYSWSWRDWIGSSFCLDSERQSTGAICKQPVSERSSKIVDAKETVVRSIVNSLKAGINKVAPHAFLHPEGERGIARMGHRGYIGGMWEEIGQLQFDFLLSKGLKPDSYLLDIACGSLRLGVKAIPFLDPGHYLGIEKESGLVSAGLDKELDPEVRREKQPTIVISGSFEFEKLGHKADFAIAQSLFTHLPPDLIELCYRNLYPWLEDHGVFYATFFETEHRGKNPTKPHDHSKFPYTRAEICNFGNASGFTSSYIGDWKHPRNQVIVEYRKANKQIVSPDQSHASSWQATRAAC